GYDGTIYKKYGVYFDPLNPDTNGNGILDGDEVFGQSKKQTVSTNDEAITEIKVDMDTNGSLERNLTIENMYGIDAMSSDVYAMIGEPFNFTSETSFESATITFKIDKSKLGDTKFDNLIILWYNEEKQIFEEMPTTRNWENSTVSATTTHFHNT
ncbi:von Willebrand factor type A domain protein, partial [human gut metagenome]